MRMITIDTSGVVPTKKKEAVKNSSTEKTEENPLSQ